MIMILYAALLRSTIIILVRKVIDAKQYHYFSKSKVQPLWMHINGLWIES
jgi:hypothetical protein